MIQDFRPPSGKIILFTHVSGVISALVLVAGLQWMAGRANTESVSPQPIAAVTTAPIPTAPNQTDANQAIARQAWQYFAQNWRASGFVNPAIEQTNTTLADVATTLLALTSARELDVIPAAEFDQKLTTLLNTLESLAQSPDQLASTYDVETAAAVIPEPISADAAAQELNRLTRSLKVVASRYPQYAAQIDRISQSWPTSEQPSTSTNTSDADLFAGIESGFPTLPPTSVDRVLAAEITQHQATAPDTANTNGLILSSLLYQKVQQPLLAWAGGTAP
jgi:Protein of unknown function (DUF3131)